MVSLGKRRGFVSDGIFRALGFKFSSVLVVTGLGYLGQRHAYPSLQVYNSWNKDNDFSSVAPANPNDLNLPVGKKRQN